MKMRTVQVKDLEGVTLDWAVAKCLGLPIRLDPMGFGSGSEAGYWIWDDAPGGKMLKIGVGGYSPSTDMSQGGNFLEQEQISLASPSPIDDRWTAMMWRFSHAVNGPTALVAISRCVVLSRMGETIEVPETLHLKAA